MLLVFLAANAFAQTQPKGPAEQSDVSASIRQLVQADQSEAVKPAPSAGDVRTQPLIRIFPYGKRSKQTIAGIQAQTPANAHLTYFGGPVMSNIQVVAVFWGPDVAAGITGNGAIDQFYTDITSSQYFDELFLILEVRSFCPRVSCANFSSRAAIRRGFTLHLSS
ncbi:MAG TPA: hypothetical protein VFY05_08630 [Candidatus Angelobacter sp.]|nr:hypothetical protein [Candidatus Angelobacter sp.]